MCKKNKQTEHISSTMSKGHGFITENFTFSFLNVKKTEKEFESERF